MKHEHNHSEENILIAFILNLVFSVVEIIGGILTGSTAIFSDAIHDLSDSIALGTSFFTQKFSNKKPTQKYSFGFKRLTVLGALINVIILSVGSFYIIYEAIKSIFNPNEVLTMPMIYLAIFGIIVNGISVFRMKSSHKILDKTVLLHLFEDLLGWVAVLITSIIIHFTGLYILDPILSLFIVIVILRNIKRSFVTIIEILMNGTTDLDFAKMIKNKLRKLDDIESFNDFHLWSDDGDYYTLMISVNTYNNKTNNVLEVIKTLLEQNNITHSIVEIIVLPKKKGP